MPLPRHLVMNKKGKWVNKARSLANRCNTWTVALQKSRRRYQALGFPPVGKLEKGHMLYNMAIQEQARMKRRENGKILPFVHKKEQEDDKKEQENMTSTLEVGTFMGVISMSFSEDIEKEQV